MHFLHFLSDAVYQKRVEIVADIVKNLLSAGIIAAAAGLVWNWWTARFELILDKAKDQGRHEREEEYKAKDAKHRLELLEREKTHFRSSHRWAMDVYNVNPQRGAELMSTNLGKIVSWLQENGLGARSETNTRFVQVVPRWQEDLKTQGKVVNATLVEEEISRLTLA